MQWTAKVLLAVAFFVSGMLCLVQAQRVHARLGGGYTLGPHANVVMTLVGAVIALFIVSLSTDVGAQTRHLFSESRLRTRVVPWVIAFGLLFFVGNMVFFDGLVEAPNAGYARALMTVEVVALTVLSALLFGDAFMLRQVMGVVAVVIGAVLVSV